MSFERVCQDISSNIFQIGNNVSVMHRLVGQLGTAAEGPDCQKQLDLKFNDVQRYTEITNNKLREAANLCKGVSPQEEKSRKIQLERLRNQFGETLKRFKKYQTTAAEKERAAINRMRSRTVSLRDEMNRQPIVDTGYADDDHLVDDEARQQNLAQLQEFSDDLETTTALINEREEAIRRLETDMVSVNEIFREIGAMVYEQGEMMDIIENNVETARDKVEDGVVELKKASDYQGAYRKKVCIFLMILVIMGVVIGLVVWVTTKKKHKDP